MPQDGQEHARTHAHVYNSDIPLNQFSQHNINVRLLFCLIWNRPNDLEKA